MVLHVATFWPCTISVLDNVSFAQSDFFVCLQVSAHLMNAQSTLNLVPLNPLALSSGTNIAVFNQNNVKASRKVVLPHVRDWLVSANWGDKNTKL